jgi:hypothetical protein
MLILKTNPIHRFKIDFLEENGKLIIKTTLEPTMTSKHFYGGKEIVLIYSELGDISQKEYVVYVLRLLKKYFPNNSYNADSWIEKCRNSEYYNESYYNAKRTRESRFYNYEYMLNNNKFEKDVVKDINSRMEKIRTVYRVKKVVEEYNKYIELREKFGVEYE